MEVSWVVLLVSAAILISLVLLAFVCLDCRNKGPLALISQTNTSAEYIPSTQFRVIHSAQSASIVNSLHSPTNLLSPQSNNLVFPQRIPSYAPTETESNPSYENPVPGPDSIESDVEEGYIQVLPEPEGLPANPSRASSISSDTQHDYENVAKPDSESSSLPKSGDYLNVDPQTCSPSTPELSSQSDSDDYEANYVNQPSMIGN
ncbi:uncharacterized protein LOC121628821 [Melanotaenia boesemani]|uniref:uncharacterized protein LOC121628821 n=1 Tax=Melanotaenia boesemani TaxID=1250792 RepID=UPI001C03D7B0|nr:uncharacterized protein LOC121628821 [Melanotaenia boesemani]